MTRKVYRHPRALLDVEGATVAREELLERTLAGLGFDYASVAVELEELARDLYRAKEHERAAKCMDEILRIRRETLGEEDSLTLGSMRDAMKVAIKLERWDELEARGTEYYEAHLRALGAADSKTQKCVRRMVEAYEKKGDEVLAESWRAKQEGAGDEQ